MIRANSLFCKLFSKKTSTKSLFLSFMDSYRPERDSCPSCHSTGNLSSHAFYDRDLIDFLHGDPVITKIRVKRVKCSLCKHTHAILPDLIIPYQSYGLFFILHTLAEYFSGRYTVAVLCEHFGISVSTLYRWRSIFLDHKDLWLGVVSSVTSSPYDFILKLRQLDSFSSFSIGFFHLSGCSFLQLNRSYAAYSPRLPG